jgi:anhydro-N-acetylmuramic acid kinase
MLQKLLTRKRPVVIGLNSGTSADGLDLAAVRMTPSKSKFGGKLLAGKTVPYPRAIQKRLTDAINNRIDSIDDLVRLDRELGRFFGDRARQLADLLRVKGIRAHLIASHGQTVRHLPGKVIVGKKKESGTLQLGHPETIADRTGLVTVADFRQADIASGGEGAPITSGAMWHLFSSDREDRMIINIGGIANYFVLPKGRPAGRMLAADCGPGNSLLDIIARRCFEKKYDRNGRLAAKGSISKRLLSMLMADNYLKGKYGPSTGRERFGEKFVEKTFRVSSGLGLSRHDILATATELTAVSIARSIGPHLKRFNLKTVYLFGGGLNNGYLVERLKANLPDVSLFSIDRLGFDPHYLEAVCYALMGVMTIYSIPAGLPNVTGAVEKTVAGRIVQPPRG